MKMKMCDYKESFKLICAIADLMRAAPIVYVRILLS